MAHHRSTSPTLHTSLLMSHRWNQQRLEPLILKYFTILSALHHTRYRFYITKPAFIPSYFCQPLSQTCIQQGFPLKGKKKELGVYSEKLLKDTEGLIIIGIVQAFLRIFRKEKLNHMIES